MRTSSFCLATVVIVIGVILPLSCSGSTYLETFLARTPIMPNNEIRAAWVVRHALNSREDIDRAIDYAVQARFQLLFVQVRGRADAYYRSAIEPPAESLTTPVEDFDPLQYLLVRAHAESIAVHTWVNVFYVWSNYDAEPPADHIVSRHPEWLMADDRQVRMDELPVEQWQSRGLEGYYVSPSSSEVRQYTVSVIKDIADRYPIDGMHLDYIRYPSDNFDFGTPSRTRFALRYGVDPLSLRDRAPSLTDLVAEHDLFYLDSLYTEWRSAQVDSLVRMVRGAIGDLPLSAAVIPDFSRAHLDKGQNWVRWVSDGYVDFVVPMAYTYEPAELAERVKLIKRYIGTGRFLVGLPAFDDRSRYLGYSISLLRREGILGYSIFSYNALAAERFSLQFIERVFFGNLAGDEGGE